MLLTLVEEFLDENEIKKNIKSILKKGREEKMNQYKVSEQTSKTVLDVLSQDEKVLQKIAINDENLVPKNQNENFDFISEDKLIDLMDFKKLL